MLTNTTFAARSYADVRVRVLAAVAVFVITSALSACNTTKGAGKDMENLGENIQNSAERSKP